MRELTMDELEKVSGGDVTETVALLGTVAGIGSLTYGSSWATVGALTAIGMSPIAALAMVGLAFYGGYQLFQD